MTDGPSFALANFPDGSVLLFYSESREYWLQKPGDSTYPAEHLSAALGADRVVHQGGTVLPGAYGASSFYEAVREAAKEERDG